MNYSQKLYETLKIVYQLYNNNSCGKLVRSLESKIIFNDRL